MNLSFGLACVRVLFRLQCHCVPEKFCKDFLKNVRFDDQSFHKRGYGKICLCFICYNRVRFKRA